ncbi:MAG: hypothetical protein KDA57_03705 [Planctomycetales bacterium]|nr:hypothetical protein [Planctomycetales bacterium]
MDQILEQVSRARRRLGWELFLNRLVRCWFFGLFLALLAIAAPKVATIENLPANWSLQCGLAAILGGALVAAVWTWWRGRTELEAAVEIDQRYGLKERIASSLSLSATDAETPAGQALLADAVRAVRRVDIEEQFQIRFQQRAWLPLVPALLAFLLATLVDNREAQSSVDPQTKISQVQQENAAKALRKRLAERREQAAKKGLKDAEGLFRDLEKQTEKLAETRDADHKKTLVKLNDLAQQLEQRRQELGGDQELRKQFEKMGKFKRGPADKMVEAMKQGQWQKAISELDKLKKQIETGKLDPEAKKELEEQLSELKQKMQEASDARKQAMDELKKEIEKEKKQGNLSRAGELQQKLDQMQQQQQKMEQLAQLAQKMGECQQCMKEGDSQGAAKSLSEMMQQMEQLQQELEESEMLEMAMDQLQMAKDSMACSQCQGMGCQACQGNGMSDQFSENQGNGMGAGRGYGPRPDEKNPTNFRDSRVRQNPGRGAAVIVGEADGPNRRGQVVEAVKEQMAVDAGQPADPLVVEKLPKSHREHAEEYFNRLREGQ